MSRAFGAVYRHWFEPASLRELAMVRIIVVASQLIFFLPSLDSQIWLAAADAADYVPRPALKVLLLPFTEWGGRPGPTFLQAVWVGAVVSGVLAVIGRFTRPAMLAFAAANTLMVAHTYSYREFHHPEAILIIALWVLALAPSGAALSLDDLKRRMYASVRFMAFRPQTPDEYRSEFARWPLRTIQWLFVLVYLSAGLSKLSAAGLDWLNGYTLGYYLLQDGLRWDAPLGVYLHDKIPLLVGLSAVTLLFELTFVLAVLVPVLTPIYLITGVGMHTGILVLMKAPFFQWIVLYSAFGDQLRRAFARLGVPSRARAQWTVVYDAGCGLCIRSMVLLDYLDLGRRLRFVDLEQGYTQAGVTLDAARHAMRIVAPDSRETAAGFLAFRRLARLLPPLWPLLPLFYLPLAERVGPAFYRRVAANRCTTGSCGLPPPPRSPRPAPAPVQHA